MRARSISLAVLVVCVFWSAVALGAPKPGVFAGTLGVQVPAGARAQVRAIDGTSGLVVAAARTNRAGAFRLRMPPGQYYVAGSVMLPRGAARRVGVAVSLTAGQRRAGARLTARRGKAARATRRPMGQRAAALPGRDYSSGMRVVMSVPRFRTARNGPAARIPDLTDSLITDLADHECAAVVEADRLGEARTGIRGGTSPYTDSAARGLRPASVSPDLIVKGSVTNWRGAALGRVVIVHAASGKEFARWQGWIARPGSSVDSGQFARSLNRLSQWLVQESCRMRAARFYAVALKVRGSYTSELYDVSGTLDGVVQTNMGAMRWTGNSTLTWANLVITNRMEECSVGSPVPGTQPWPVTITAVPPPDDEEDLPENRRIRVDWSPGSNGTAGLTTVTISCPDSPPISGEPGPQLIGAEQEFFYLPATGGVHGVSGHLGTGVSGFEFSGTVTVTPGVIIYRS